MEYFSAEDILRIHSAIIDETGGTHGVRNKHAISSLENAPRQAVFGKELYPTIFLKAAVYAREIIMTHPFIDGNKRTGMVCAATFLENNGYLITIQEGNLENFALSIVREKVDLEGIADWFKKNSKKIGRK